MASHNTVEKTIYVYDLDGNYIRHHEYLDYATVVALKESINPNYDFIKYKALIYNCLRGIMLKVGNRRFSWIPHSNFPLPSEIIYINNVKHFKYEVFKYDFNGIFIEKFCYTSADAQIVNNFYMIRSGKSYFYKGYYYLKEKYVQIPNEIFNKIQPTQSYPFHQYDINGFYVKTFPNIPNNQPHNSLRSLWKRNKKYKGFYYLKEKYDKIPEVIFNKIKYSSETRGTRYFRNPIYKYGLDGKFIEELYYWDSKVIFFGKRFGGDWTKYKGYYYLKKKYIIIPEIIFHKIKYSDDVIKINLIKWKC
jgi:hypothetical protein